jgi:hypothetical protein
MPEAGAIHLIRFGTAIEIAALDNHLAAIDADPP